MSKKLFAYFLLFIILITYCDATYEATYTEEDAPKVTINMIVAFLIGLSKLILVIVTIGVLLWSYVKSKGWFGLKKN